MHYHESSFGFPLLYAFLTSHTKVAFWSTSAANTFKGFPVFVGDDVPVKFSCAPALLYFVHV